MPGDSVAVLTIFGDRSISDMDNEKSGNLAGILGEDEEAIDGVHARNSHGEKHCDGENRSREQSSVESSAVIISKHSNIRRGGNVNFLIDCKIVGNTTVIITHIMLQEERVLIDEKE